jgi:hypothetical protein
MPRSTKGPTAEDVYEKLRSIVGAHDRAAVLEVLREALACPICGGTSRVCPACAGRAGGRRMTTKKWRQLKSAAKRPRPGRRKKHDRSA